MKTFVFTGGGTGGHIYPGVAVVEEMRTILKKKNITRHFQFIWIGSNNGSDKNIVEKSGSIDKFYGIPSGKFRRYFSFKNLFDIFKIIFGFFSAFFLLLKIKPDFLFSKGGFVSVPPCVAAKLLKIPVYTHECDFSPGLATKINKIFATKIMLSYEDTKKFFDVSFNNKIIVTGNPVRSAFFNANAEAGKNFLQIASLSEKKKKLPILLVIGGSLGSRQINNLVWENIEWLCENFIVVHQCGNDDIEMANAKKSEKAIENYLIYSFIYTEMADVMQAADVVLSRAGANFLWECAVCKKPMILVPLSRSGSRGDQIENADFFAKNGVAFVLNGNDVNAENLQDKLTKLLNVNIRNEMSENYNKICAEIRSAEKIAQIILDEVLK
ncbi:MAG: undecaprenyldiphospho-muramoylpentapeptide beta-N-acetylglucosaminyltransferase [Treponema sp.]|nr:undecaprenyldiphospho-muramoylpentapeptide beta-N-acetylglucosaminyltransferase [Treponema sp.]